MALPNPVIEAELWSVGASPAYSMKSTQALLDALTAINRAYLAEHQAPRLYQSGVRYQRERGRESWRAVPAILRAGFGDCEDLAAWRAAELQKQGKRARAVLVRVAPRLMHVVVERGGGRFEDPSKVLGMKGEA